MVIDRGQRSAKKPVKQGRGEDPPEPTKINASTRFDFAGKNLTAYGGLLPVATLLEKLQFQQLVEGMRQRNPPIAREASVMKWRNEKKTSDWERSTAAKPGGSRAVGRRV